MTQTQAPAASEGIQQPPVIYLILQSQLHPPFQLLRIQMTQDRKPFAAITSVNVVVLMYDILAQHFGASWLEK